MAFPALLPESLTRFRVLRLTSSRNYHEFSSRISSSMVAWISRGIFLKGSRGFYLADLYQSFSYKMPSFLYSSRDVFQRLFSKLSSGVAFWDPFGISTSVIINTFHEIASAISFRRIYRIFLVCTCLRDFLLRSFWDFSGRSSRDYPPCSSQNTYQESLRYYF